MQNPLLNPAPIRLFVLIFVSLAFFTSCNVIKRNDNPNILFLFTDDQRYNTIHALGNGQIITPNLDKLADRGLYFSNAYIMGSMSGAVCAPSRAMLMSGRNVYHIDPMGKTISESHKTLPKSFSEQGYNTFHTGKWHNGKDAFARSFDTGSAIFFGGMSDHYNVPLYPFDTTGTYEKSGVYYQTGKHSAEIYTDAAIRFLENYKQTQPFFMFVSFQTPHDPREMPEEYLHLYNAESIYVPPNFMPMHPFDNGELDIRDELLAGFPRTEEEVKANIAAYYAMITHTDAQIGRILRKLEEKGLTKNTIVVFAGDNGLAVGQHGLMGKQNLYEHSIKVPLLFAGPDIPNGNVTNAYCYLYDLYPTLCDMAGITTPESVQGQSLAPVITGKKRNHREDMVYAYKTFQRAYRKGKWKLITYNVNDNVQAQLFDLKNDPFETNNLIKNAVYTDTVTQLMQFMQEQFNNQGDSVDFSKPDWNLSIHTGSWKDRVQKENPEIYEKLMKMVEEERSMRGF